MGIGMTVAAVFLLTVAVVGVLAVFAQRVPGALLRRRLQHRITDLVAPEEEARASGLIKHDVRGPLPGVDRMIGGTARGFALGRWIEQSGVRVSVSALLLGAVASSLLVGLLSMAVTRQPLARLAAAAIGATLPFAFLKHRRTKRLRKFEEQFPEALDLVSRAVRAGHAFSSGMKMVADEVNDPVGPEFRKAFEEQNYGLPLKDALFNLSQRVPLLDVRFFATAVLIQRETGGNLAEILDNLSHVVRERFKILRQVRVHTAHGRFTGYVLLGMPAVLSVALMFISPDHMNLLFRERMGQMMLMGAIGMQTVGYLWIRQIIKIEV